MSVRVPVFATLRMGVMDDEGPLVSGQGPKSGKDAAADGLSALERAKIWEEVDELNEKMDLAVGFSQPKLDDLGFCMILTATLLQDIVRH